jgi:DNA-damage-inducible protein J
MTTICQSQPLSTLVILPAVACFDPLCIPPLVHSIHSDFITLSSLFNECVRIASIALQFNRNFNKGFFTMANDTVQIRVTRELKEQAESVFKAMGLKTSEAIRLFLQQVVNSGGLPFQPTAKQPNAETLEAMEEIANGGGERFKNTDDLFKSWDEK